MRIFQTDTAAFDPNLLASVIERTKTRTWSIDLTLLQDQVLSFIEKSPEALSSLVGEWEALSQGAPKAQLSDAQRKALSQEPLPAQKGWVRATTGALSQSEWLQKETSVDPGQLSGLVDQDATWRSVAHFSGLAKDGAMDLRALEAAFGWFLVQQVTDAIRRRLRGLSPEAQARLVSDFGPMLALLGQVQDEADKSRVTFAKVQADAEAEAAAAEAEAEAAETMLSYQKGEQPPTEAVLMALSHDRGAPPASVVPGKRSARRTSRKARR
jgi:hypothetical protein